VTESKIIAIGRRARERAIARGDMEALQRAEIWLFRAVKEQEHHDAAEFAGLVRELAIRDLVAIHRRDNDD
jgi:hypothetical protein